MISDERADEIMRRAQAVPHDKPMYSRSIEEHMDDIRGELLGNVSIDPTNAELRQVIDDNPDVVGLAYQWGWGDTEVREKICALVEQIHPRY